MSGLSDAYHYMGGDLYGSNTGDVHTVTGTILGQQRVLRRLLTNPGDYIFHPEYGAGLPRMVGDVADLRKIEARARGQMLLEDCVARNPAPVVSASKIDGGVFLQIQYSDRQTKQTVTLSVPITNSAGT